MSVHYCRKDRMEAKVDVRSGSKVEQRFHSTLLTYSGESTRLEGLGGGLLNNKEHHLDLVIEVSLQRTEKGVFVCSSIDSFDLQYPLVK